MKRIKYLDEFRAPEVVKKLASELQSIEPPQEKLTFMEVCGTHTMSIFRNGIRQLLPPWLKLISGPGCPVCVTDDRYIAQACKIGQTYDAIIVTFGDLMPVPGLGLSLEKARAQGVDVRVVYSPYQALSICQENPGKEVVYLAVGFETTAPLSASLLQDVQKKDLQNFSMLVAHKLIPPAMKALIADEELGIDGFICPPHVSTIIGAQAFHFIPRENDRPCVIAGFESTDILMGLQNLTQQIGAGHYEVANLYRRAVKDEGNAHARNIMYSIYEPADDTWRGIGLIPGSGLQLKSALQEYDAARRFKVTLPEVKPTQCRCGDILRGIITPKECPLFATACSPDQPVGPCMVSSEGTCAAYYKYDRG